MCTYQGLMGEGGGISSLDDVPPPPPPPPPPDIFGASYIPSRCQKKTSALFVHPPSKKKDPSLPMATSFRD